MSVGATKAQEVERGSRNPLGNFGCQHQAETRALGRPARGSRVRISIILHSYTCICTLWLDSSALSSVFNASFPIRRTTEKIIYLFTSSNVDSRAVPVAIAHHHSNVREYRTESLYALLVRETNRHLSIFTFFNIWSCENF